MVHIGHGATEHERELVRKASMLCGVPITGELNDDVEYIRSIGAPPPPHLRAEANRRGIHIASDPVTASGHTELRHYVREQAVSRTLHRFGNLVG